MSREYEGKVVFVGVDVGPFTGLGTHEDAEALIEELGLSYPTAYAVEPSPLRKYQVFSMPTTVFFAADGEIVDTHAGVVTEQQLRDLTERTLAASN